MRFGLIWDKNNWSEIEHIRKKYKHTYDVQALDKWIWIWQMNMWNLKIIVGRWDTSCYICISCAISKSGLFRSECVCVCLSKYLVTCYIFIFSTIYSTIHTCSCRHVYTFFNIRPNLHSHKSWSFFTTCLNLRFCPYNNVPLLSYTCDISICIIRAFYEWCERFRWKKVMCVCVCLVEKRGQDEKTKTIVNKRSRDVKC